MKYECVLFFRFFFVFLGTNVITCIGNVYRQSGCTDGVQLRQRATVTIGGCGNL